MELWHNERDKQHRGTIGIGQALLWLRDMATHTILSTPKTMIAPATILFDSCYVANMVTA